MDAKRSLVWVLGFLWVAGSGCATVAEFRDLERRLVALDRRTQGPTDQQERLAELGAELGELREQLADLKGSIEELEFAIAQLRQAGPGPAPGSGGSTLGGALQGGPQAGGGASSSETDPDLGKGSGAAGTDADREAPGGRSSAGPAPGRAGASNEVRSYEEAFRAYRAAEYPAAIDRFKSFLQTYPSSPYADNALFWLGECYLKVGDHERAVLAFEDVVKKFPDGGKVPDALYRQGIALLELGGQSPQQGQKEAYQSAAREIFERIVREHPDSERVPEARRQLDRLGT